MFAGLPHSEELLQNLCQADRWDVRPAGKPKTFLQQGIIPEQAYFAGQLSPLKLSHDDEEPWQVRLESLRFASWTGLPIALWDFEMPRPSTTLSVRAHTHNTAPLGASQSIHTDKWAGTDESLAQAVCPILRGPGPFTFWALFQRSGRLFAQWPISPHL